MNFVEGFFDKGNLNNLKKNFTEINKIFSQLLNSIFELQDEKYEEKIPKEITFFNEIIEKNQFSNKKDYLNVKQAYFKDLKSLFNNYFEKISKIYENVKRMKEYHQELENLINDINPESEIQNLSSCSIDNYISTNNESDGDEEKGLSSKIYEGCAINNDDISKNICQVCSKEKASFFYNKSNQFICNSCLEEIKKEEKLGNKVNNAVDNIQNIVKMKDSNEIRKQLFLNSLNILFKIVILKADYLLNNQSQEIKIKNGEANISNINFIKKTSFEYPVINDINNINNSTEINFLNNINNILENNFEINTKNMKIFDIYKINEDLVDSLMNIFIDEKKEKEEKYSSNFEIRKSVKQQQDFDIDNAYNVDDSDITDEKNIINNIKVNKNKNKDVN